MNKNRLLFLLEGILLFIILKFNEEAFIAYIFIVFHEASHILAAYNFNIKPKGFRIHFTGVNCSLNGLYKINNNRKIIIFFVGPLLNLFIGVIFITIAKITNNTFIMRLGYINLALFIFNMLPAYPLDGSRIFECIIQKKYSYKSTKKIMELTSFICSGIFAILFVFTIYIHKTNFSILVSSVLIIFSTIAQKRGSYFYLIGDILSKKKYMDENIYIENRCFSVNMGASLTKAVTLLDANKLNYIYVVDDNLALIKIICEKELVDAAFKFGNITFKDYLYKDE